MDWTSPLSRRALRRATITAAGTAALACAAATPAGAYEQFWLDTQLDGTPEAPKGPGFTTASSFMPLTAGAKYLVFSRGVTSVFVPEMWSDAGYFTCGTPDDVLMGPGDGPAPGPGGEDPEFILARPYHADRNINQTQWCANRAFPRKRDLMVFDVGSGFSHPTPLGAPATPRADHLYAYPVTGAGQNVDVRVLDDNTNDNYGSFKFTVMSGADCANGGWTLGQTATGFTSQADCDEYFGNTPPPGPPPGGGIGGVVVPPGGDDDNIVPPQPECTSKRRFKIHIRVPRKFGLRKATVRVDGKRIKVNTKKSKRRPTAMVDLRKKKKKTVIVKIRIVGRGGRVLTGTRRYHTCVAKRPKTIPKL